MVSILQTFIKAERMANWKLHLQTVQYMLPYFAASGHSLYFKVCIRIPANNATFTRNSSRCAPEIHGRIPCGETQRQVLGRIVHRPNHRASAYEKLKYKYTWRTDKRKGDDRVKACGVGLVHACLCKHQ